MLNYDDRLKEAWSKVPEHRQRQILEEMEHKAYNQDFVEYTNKDEDNILAPLVDALVDCVKVIFKHLF